MVLVFSGIYELVRHDMKPGLIPQFEYTVQQGLPSRLSHDYPKPLGIWYSEFGPAQKGNEIISQKLVSFFAMTMQKTEISSPQIHSNTMTITPLCSLVFSLFPHENLEAREKHREVLMAEQEWRETCQFWTR